MGRPPCCELIGVKKGPWTPEEDQKLLDYISKHGHGSWRTVPKHAGLNRCGKSCRLRWTNYLRPDIKRGRFTEEEEQLIINLHSALGNKWSKIATHLPGRTDNEIKNLWNTNIRKKLLQMGIDPETHKPRTDLKHLMNLSQMLGISNNNTNLISPWAHSALGLQQPDVTQLAQINLLLNLLQLINGNSFVNNMDNNALSLLGNNHNLINYNPLEAHVNAAPNSTFLHNKGDFLRGQELYASPALFPPARRDSQQDISKSWTDNIEGGSNPKDFGYNNNNSISSTSSPETNEAENPVLPALVSATFNQMESGSNTDQVSTDQSPSSSIFDAWEKLLEDDTSDSYWKEILDLTSTSASPISW